MKKSLAVILLAGFAFLGSFYFVWAYLEKFKTEIFLLKSEQIHPKEELILNFSQAMWDEDYKNEINLSPSEKFQAMWEEDGRKLKIVPEKFWSPQTTYQITLPSGKNKALVYSDQKTISFSTLAFPRVKEIIPSDGKSQVDLGSEDPIQVSFSSSAEDFFFRFSLEPKGDLWVEASPDRKSFLILPKGEINYETSYKIKIEARYINDKDENFRPIFSSTFTTGPAPQITWEKDYVKRLEQAKKYTRAKILVGKYIDINLSTQVMTIFENGKALDAFMVSSGKRGMETQKGETKIYNKAPRAYSREYGLYMPYWMALAASGKFGIHELPEWPGGYKEGAAHLGTPVSHGCVRLGVGPAERVYSWAEIGTPVVVY